MAAACTRLRQALHAGQLLGLVVLAVLQRRLDIQQGGGHFHGQRGRRPGARAQRDHGGALQGLTEQLAAREQLGQGFGELAAGFVKAGGTRRIAFGAGAPGLLGDADAALRLHDPGRVDAAQAVVAVVADRSLVEPVGDTHRAQARRLAGARFAGLRTKEQQVLHQAVGDLVMALQMAAQLRQQARDHALDQLVAGQHAQRLGLEMRGGELPEAGLRLAAEGHAEAGAELGQVRRVRRVGVAHLLEQGQLEGGAQARQA